MGTAVGRDHGVAGQLPTENIDDRRRVPVLVEAAFRLERLPDGSQLFDGQVSRGVTPLPNASSPAPTCAFRGKAATNTDLIWPPIPIPKCCHPDHQPTARRQMARHHRRTHIRPFGDAILDRIVHNAHRINLDGPSMRKTIGENSNPNDVDHAERK